MKKTTMFIATSLIVAGFTTIPTTVSAETSSPPTMIEDSEKEQTYYHQVQTNYQNLVQLETQLDELLTEVEEGKMINTQEARDLGQKMYTVSFDNFESIQVPENQDELYNVHVEYANYYTYIADELTYSENVEQSLETTISSVQAQAISAKEQLQEEYFAQTGEKLEKKS